MTIGLPAGVLCSTGDTQQAEPLAARLAPGSYGPPAALSWSRLVRGEAGQAVEWAGKAIDERRPDFLNLINTLMPYGRLLKSLCRRRG